MTALSVVMIARDEERCIARALHSARTLTEDVVVVDTGSTDDTVSIAEACGARVSFFEWVDDFSAAKNFALQQARGDQRLVMDADEWVVAGQVQLGAWLDDVGPCFGEVMCRSDFDSGGKVQEQVDPLIRFLPRGAVFTGRVHEQPAGNFEIARSPLVLRHDGYLQTSLARKRGRNERLLRKVLADRPDDGYSWFQLGCALESERRFAEACTAFAEAMPRVGPSSPQRHPLIVRYLHCLGASGAYEKAIDLFRAESPSWPDSPDLHFVMADVLWSMGESRPHHAVTVVPLIRRLLERCLDIGERPGLPGTVVGRGSTSARTNLEALSPVERTGRMNAPRAGSKVVTT